MKKLRLIILMVSMLFAIDQGCAIIQQGAFFSSHDEVIYAKEYSPYKQNFIGISFEIGYLAGNPFYGIVSFHNSIAGKVPDWISKLSDDDNSICSLCFKFKDIDEPVVYKTKRTFSAATRSDKSVCSFAFQFENKDDSFLKYLKQKDIEWLIVAGPNATKGSFDEKFMLMFDGAKPKEVLDKIIAKANEVIRKPNSNSRPSYGECVFHGYTYEWNDYHGRSHENNNGTLTLETRSSHYIGLKFNYTVTNIVPKNNVKWSTRKGAINISLPKGVTIASNDEIISWENIGRSNGYDYRSVVLFIWSPATYNLQVVWATRRYWTRWLNDVYYFRTTDSSVWDKIKPILLQELPYCGSRIN